jgi:hypothetical protein
VQAEVLRQAEHPQPGRVLKTPVTIKIWRGDQRDPWSESASTPSDGVIDKVHCTACIYVEVVVLDYKNLRGGVIAHLCKEGSEVLRRPMKDHSIVCAARVLCAAEIRENIGRTQGQEYGIRVRGDNLSKAVCEIGRVATGNAVEPVGRLRT